jgi:hypothetical protein
VPVAGHELNDRPESGADSRAFFAPIATHPSEIGAAEGWDARFLVRTGWETTGEASMKQFEGVLNDAPGVR